jgi:hypothetical protein
MNKRNKTILIILLMVLTIAIVAGSCSKDTAGTKVELSYNMLQDKTWYLDNTQTIVNTTVTNRSYVGQATYFITFLSNKLMTDSYGVTGNYTITNAAGQLNMVINGKTSGGNTVNYNYIIESIGASNLVLTYTNAGTMYKMFYSAK